MPHFSDAMDLNQPLKFSLHHCYLFFKETSTLWCRRYYIWRYARVLDWEQYKVEGPIPFPPVLKAKIRGQLEYRERQYPNSTDGKWLDVDAGLGYDCYVCEEGEAFMEHWKEDLSLATEEDRDRTVVGRTMALVLGLLNFPELAMALPRRPSYARDCGHCGGLGWHKFLLAYIICSTCGGLGWRVWEGENPHAR
jgi:hypothetical protein